MINLRIYDGRLTVLVFLYAILIILGVSFLTHTVLVAPLMSFNDLYRSYWEWPPPRKRVYNPRLLNYELMRPRLTQYALFNEWRYKIHPNDAPYVNFLSEDIEVSIQVYVSDVKDAVVYRRDSDEPDKILATFYVCQASNETVAELLRIPHLSFYASKFANRVAMRVDKRQLARIARFPFVYCIRVIPDASPAS